jgi:hypothetical protein
LDTVLVRDVNVTLSVEGETVNLPELPVALAATAEAHLLGVYLCSHGNRSEQQNEGE